MALTNPENRSIHNMSKETEEEDGATRISGREGRAQPTGAGSKSTELRETKRAAGVPEAEEVRSAEAPTPVQKANVAGRTNGKSLGS